MTSNLDTIIVDSPFGVKTAKVHAEHAQYGAIDIETTIGNPWRGETELVSVGITWDGKRSFIFKADEYLDKMRSLLKHGKWIMHNGLFDKLMMAEFGYEVNLVHDTMAMQYLLDPDLDKDLETCSERYLGLPAYKDVDYENILDEPFDKVAKMNGEDVRRTFNIFRPLADKLNQDKALSRVYQWLLMPAVNELIEVTRSGVPLDQGRLTALTEEFTEQVAGLLSELRAVTPPPLESYGPEWKGRKRKADPPPEFNPGSVEQVRHIIYDQWDLPRLEYNTDAQGNNTTPSTNADVLLQLETDYATKDQEKWLSMLRGHRKAKKVLDAYLLSWPSLVDAESKLHPRYKPLHVVTGRLSSDQPNIQNVPREKRFRNLFGGIPGKTWIKADYSQVELRIAAWQAQEQTMLQAFREGGDLHRLTAIMVLGDDSDEARQVAKTLNFGLLYGAGPSTLQRVARTEYNVFLDYRQAKEYREEFFRAYPALEAWHLRMNREISATGQSRSPLGRIRYLPKAKIPWSVEDMRGQKIHAILEGTNHPVQSMASDLLLMSLVRVAPLMRELGVEVVAEVHDEMDFLCPDEYVTEAVGTIKTTMEDTSWLQRFGINLTVPVVAEVTTGTYWGDTE